jgi:hypothetical protein
MGFVISSPLSNPASPSSFQSFKELVRTLINSLRDWRVIHCLPVLSLDGLWLCVILILITIRAATRQPNANPAQGAAK